MNDSAIQEFFLAIWNIYTGQLPYIIALAAFFTMLTFFENQRSSPDKVWWRNPGNFTDLCHLLFNLIVTRYARAAFILLFFFLVAGNQAGTSMADYFEQGRAPLHGLPFWVQAIVYVLLADFLSYWIHRLFHSVALWKYHAIHHSATQVDWTTAYRFHPVNLIFEPILVGAIVLLLGIPPEVILFLVPWDIFSAGLVHANVKWTFGPLKYVLASPVFHRWHHCEPGGGGDMNFAPTFSFWDVLFGTFYMPEGRLPQNFGVDDKCFPEDYLKQLAYPFKPGRRLEAADRTENLQPGK
jgi:sterol desaturase/sphingolipid hydroxylase (fatty acid hydroxylase superfamily)